MKLLIGGATGFVGRAVLAQALKSDAVMEIVTVGHRALPSKSENREGQEDGEGNGQEKGKGDGEGNGKKVEQIVLRDGDEWSEEMVGKLGGVGGCIWKIAVTPSKSKTTPFEETRRVTRDGTLQAISALAKANVGGGGNEGKGVRFVYMSGAAVSRDLDQDWEAKGGFVSPEYFKMRCTLEVELINFAKESKGGAVEVCCVRPGYIEGDRGIEGYQKPDYGKMNVPFVERRDLVAAMLKFCAEGIEKDPVTNGELVGIGREAVERYG